jgi:hypothetical protein
LNAADIIATCALLFTTGSFWWLYARPGKLQIVGEPRSYSFAAARDLTLNLPLVFTNSRPMPAIAINLRLHLDAPGFPSIVPFVATRDAVKPKDGSAGREMATAIVMQGRETRLICCEFISEPYDVVVANGINLRVTVEAVTWSRWRRSRWQPLLAFPLRLSEEAVNQRGRYLTYDNQLSDLGT